MEERRIEQINYCLAHYFCDIIHGTLVGQTPTNTPKPYEYYKNRILQYADALKDYKKFVQQITNIYQLYMSRTRDVITRDMFVEEFVEHYTFEQIYQTLDGPDKVRVMQLIIMNMLRSYLKFLCKENEHCFYYAEQTPELRQRFLEKMQLKIRHHGVYVQFGIYRKDQETVPKYLFLKLRKQYDELLQETRG